MTDGRLGGCVVIGRNEGARLARCLASVAEGGRAVYVDSGSEDGSADAARAAGAIVVELDRSRPFTAARARNAGLARLLREAGGESGADYVQFVDGDCALQPGWLDAAARFLDRTPDAAVVAGRLRERRPEASIYNRLCEREWAVPPGPAKACGGIAMMRIAPVLAAGGFRESMAAGEEPELCVRLRAAGWRVWRLDGEMALHDAAMTRFGQWWVRTRRAGYAAAEGAALHGGPPERHGAAQVLRALVWGLALPVGLAAVAPWLLLAVYPAQVARLAAREGPGRRFSWIWAAATVGGKFAEALGILAYVRAYVRDGLIGRIRSPRR